MSSDVGPESVKACTACGASIYQEHIDRRLAGMWAGQLLCPACLRERKEETGAGPGENVLGSLPLVDESRSAGGIAEDSGSGAPGLGAAESRESDEASYLPPSSEPGRGAKRVRTFHAKLSEGAVRHLDGQINTWLESHPEIEIKFATTTVGVWEAKHAEPNLILTIFY